MIVTNTGDLIQAILERMTKTRPIRITIDMDENGLRRLTAVPLRTRTPKSIPATEFVRRHGSGPLGGGK